MSDLWVEQSYTYFCGSSFSRYRRHSCRRPKPKTSVFIAKGKAEGFVFLIKEFEVDDRGFFHDIFFQTDGKKAVRGDLLKKMRLGREMTQKELGDYLGIPQNHVSAMEHGKRGIGKKMAKRLSKVLRVDYRAFL